MEAEFSLIDVFSEVMQQLAREFNFVESTFVVPSSDPACTHRVRIFAPRTELPFAGHSTVGTRLKLLARSPGQSNVRPAAT